MGQHFDVIVVGIGAMGSAACYQLANRGLSVLGLEQFSIPNARGSSHGYSRAIRMAYYEHSDYVPLLRRAYKLWHDLEVESGQRLLHLTGGLYIGPPHCELVLNSLHSAQNYNLPAEKLSRLDVLRNYPQFQLPDDFIAMYEPQAGVLRPELAICASARIALHKGAKLQGHEAVTGWQATSYGVRVETTRANYEAGHLIFCGGAWSDKLLQHIGLKLKVTRQVVGWVWPQKPELFKSGRFPLWAIADREDRLHYGFPLMEDNLGFKIAQHNPGMVVDPDRVERQPLPGDEDTFLPALKQFLPDACGPLLSMQVCLYECSPDSHFIIDKHPLHSNVLIACGFSGHGFKFAPVVGEVLADLVQWGETKLPVEFLRLRR